MRILTKRFLSVVLVVSMVAPSFGGASADAVSKRGTYVSSLIVKYTGGDKDIGDSISESDFSVKGKKGSSTVTISNYEIDQTSVEKESNRVRISWENENGKTLTKTVTVRATLLIKKIKGKFVGDKDAIKGGYTFSKDDFKVTGTRANKKSVEIEDFQIQPETVEKPNTSVKLVYTNKLDKELRATVQVKSLTDVKSITADYVGDEKDIGDELKPEDFKVKGKDFSGKGVDITDFNMSTDKVDSENTRVDISYTNTFGSVLKKSVTVPADKLVKKIEATYKMDTLPRINSQLDKSAIKVVGVTKGKKKIDITDFEADAEVIDKERKSVKLSYTNTAGKVLTDTVMAFSHNYVESIKAEYDGKILLDGEEIPQSKIKVIATYEDGDEKKITNSAFTLSVKKVKYSGSGETFDFAVVVTYSGKDKPSKSDGGYVVPVTSCTVPVRSAADTSDFLIEKKADVRYFVGDTADIDDFIITPVGQYTADSIDTKKCKVTDAKLDDVTNTVKFQIRTTYGDTAEISKEVSAEDWVTGVELKRTSTDVKLGGSISSTEIYSYIDVVLKLKAGKDVTLSPTVSVIPFGNIEVKVSGAENPLISSGLIGSYTVKESKEDNLVTVKFENTKGTEFEKTINLLDGYKKEDIDNGDTGWKVSDSEELELTLSDNKKLTDYIDLSKLGNLTAKVSTTGDVVELRDAKNGVIESKSTIHAHKVGTATVKVTVSGGDFYSTKTYTIRVKVIKEKYTPSKKKNYPDITVGTKANKIIDIAKLLKKGKNDDAFKYMYIKKVEFSNSGNKKYATLTRSDSKVIIANKAKSSNDSKAMNIKITFAMKDNAMYELSKDYEFEYKINVKYKK